MTLRYVGLLYLKIRWLYPFTVVIQLVPFSQCLMVHIRANMFWKVNDFGANEKEVHRYTEGESKIRPKVYNGGVSPEYSGGQDLSGWEGTVGEVSW